MIALPRVAGYKSRQLNPSVVTICPRVALPKVAGHQPRQLNPSAAPFCQTTGLLATGLLLRVAGLPYLLPGQVAAAFLLHDPAAKIQD